MLPNLRPRTEDFLTFLCFRGTNSLPKELDFQNNASTSGTSKASPEKKSKDSEPSKKKPGPKKNETVTSNETEVTKKPAETDPKTGFMPFAVRKRAEIHPAKNDKKKLQMLAKKKQTKEEIANATRTTRANPVDEKPEEAPGSSKKTAKRKSTAADESQNTSTVSAKEIESSSEKKVPNSKKNTKLEEKLSKEVKSASKAKDEKRETRLSAVRGPSTSTPSAQNGVKTPISDKYFSSDDDDLPLVKAEPKNKKAKLQDPPPKSETKVEIEVPKVKSNRGRKKKVVPPVEPEPEPEKVEESEAQPEKKKVGRKKKISVDMEIANSQANTTDMSENEARGRPMRKTKEAATIYMELIGRKLTLHENSSDNDSSLDSLEVPNLKRVELMENEMKANCEKAKEAEDVKKKMSSPLPSPVPKLATSQNKSLDNSKNLKEKRGAAKELEKSFSDSDEEPLATKVAKQPEKPPPKKRGRKSNAELAEIAARQSLDEAERLKEYAAAHQSKKAAEELQKKAAQAAIKKPETPTVQKEVKAKQTPDVKNNKNTSDPPASRQQPKAEPCKADDDEFVKGFDAGISPKPSASSKPAINLLPSKEESEKIFGIASVTLAQSCGPLDTKCTLGKCGSVHVHKPPITPTVLTESALGASLSPKDRRKSKVNMTRDQIQKWLEEASWTPIPDDETETLDLKTASKASTSSVGLSKSGDDSQSSSFLREKILENKSPAAKELTLKPKPIKSESPTTAKFLAKVEDKIKSNFPLKSEEPKNKPVVVETKPAKPATPSPAKPTPSKNCEKKTPVYQQKQPPQPKRTPVYKNEAKPASNLTPMLPKSFGAFSPENEHSIYSFDREDDDLPTPTTPFRRSNSKAEGEIFPKPAVTPNKPTQPSHVSLTLSPDDNKKSASISVEMGDEVKKENESKEKNADNDSDSEGHTFYIPLQASNTSGSKTIQGVAVKLGTEGAEGPNQRIIMHAKLVTKPRANAAPLPESMSNVQELVKSLMAGKETSTSKALPCATVQPRFKSSDGVAECSAGPEPSTSSLNANQRSQQAPKLGVLTEAPIFRPTEAEFQDPIEYIERITPIASRFGICRIIPPESFKPECRVSDEMRFTAYNQYVHKMLHRWGPSSKEFSAIKKYLATQSITLQRPPLIAGIEVDLPRLYHTVQELGGLKEVIEKKKWAKVAEDMCLPKTAHDRVTKLDDIYCKYLLPYDTLSHVERQKLFDEVEADWAKRETKARRNADKGVDSDEQSNEESEESESEEDEDDNASMECMVKGRSMALSQFYRIARNLITLWFNKTPEPNLTVAEIEAEYWRHVAVRDSHVCVHYGSIDSSGYGYGFPMPGPKTKLSPCSKHPWNLKVLTNNSSSILRSLGPVMGVTVPTLHVGMLFSAVCWYRDPHGLPWIEYLHTGASKIWYAVPDEQSSQFRTALTSLVPSHCQNKTIWLPCDTTMVRNCF